MEKLRVRSTLRVRGIDRQILSLVSTLQPSLPPPFSSIFFTYSRLFFYLLFSSPFSVFFIPSFFVTHTWTLFVRHSSLETLGCYAKFCERFWQQAPLSRSGSACLTDFFTCSFDRETLSASSMIRPKATASRRRRQPEDHLAAMEADSTSSFSSSRHSRCVLVDSTCLWVMVGVNKQSNLCGTILCSAVYCTKHHV